MSAEADPTLAASSPLVAAVVIPSLNSPIIDRVVRALSCQTVGARLEVVVVGRDEAGLLAGMPRPRGMKFVDTGTPVIAGVARNIGVRQSTASPVLFLDADCIPEPDWAERMLALWRLGHQVIGGAVRFPGGGWWAHADHVSSYHVLLPEEEEGTRNRLPVGGSNLLVDRRLLEQHGLFHERLPQGEDAELVVRLRAAGFPTYYAASIAVSHHSWVASMPDALRHAYRYGRAMTMPVRLDHIESGFLWEHPRLALALLPLRAVWTPLRYVMSRRALWKYIRLLPAMVPLYAARYWGAYRALGEPLPEGATKHPGSAASVAPAGADCHDVR